MNNLHLFDYPKTLIHKMRILCNALLGELTKLAIRFGFIRPRLGITKTKRAEGNRIVISLTSYGRRVSDVLPFTLVSLLRQSVKPDYIILWLDYDNWSDDKLPISIQKLKKFGLTIRYCNNIKSYKKLIPSLELFPNDFIIAVDDDFYYSPHIVRRLIDAWEVKPNVIYTHRADGILFDGNMILPCSSWQKEISGREDSFVFPLGGSGCLYKKDLLYNDVTREDLFLSLSPNADDVWFFFMEVLNGTPRAVLHRNSWSYILIDCFYQITHKTSALYNDNEKNGGNNAQIMAVMNHYGLSKDNF